MLRLHDDLLAFSGAIVHGDAASPHIVPSYKNYTAEIAVDIYRNNYRGNLHDALAGAYHVTRQLVGDDFFRFMARKYTDTYPSRSANLHHYGAELAAFLTTFVPAQELVYLADVAVLEWACHVAYFANDEASFDIAKLALIPPEQYPGLILHIHPACQVVRSRYPIAAIWHAHQPGADCDFHIDLDSGPCIALVNRKTDAVQVEELHEDFCAWLQAMQSGLSMGAAIDATLAGYPDFDLSDALAELAAKNLLIDFKLGATT